MAIRVENEFFVRGSDEIEEGAALFGADEDVASGGEHEGGQREVGGVAAGVLHEVVEAGEKFDGEAADAVGDVVEVSHVGVVGGEAGDAGFAVDEAHGGNFAAGNDAGGDAEEGDDPRGHGGAVFGDGDGENEATRAEGAVGDGVDRHKRAHAFADNGKRVGGEVSIGKRGQVGAPFVRLEKVAAAAVVGIMALSAQIECPDGVSVCSEASGERTEVRGGTAKAVETNDVGGGAGGGVFPHETGEGGAVVAVPMEVARALGEVFVGDGRGHERAILRGEQGDGKLVEVGIGVVVGWGAAAEEAEWGVGGDLVTGAGGDEDGVAGADVSGGALDFHAGGALEEEIKFLADFVVMAVGGLSGCHGGFGEALLFDRGVGAVEDAADGGAVLSGEGALIFDLPDYHGK